MESGEQVLDSLPPSESRTPSSFRSVPTPVTTNEWVGPYRLCLEIATGGMASVYLAKAEHRTGIHRFVALKRIHPHLASDPAFVEMFLDEARVASLVQHANVCSVIDFDTNDEGHYLVMEYLMGEPLSAAYRAMAHRRIGTHAERAAIVARIIADACEGLHAAHEACDPAGEPLGVVHRDVSPENLFLTYDGVTKVCDFGVARAARQQHQTRTGVLKGKYAYMAPEVLRGEEPDRRADVWSLGVVLWELLTLKRLFCRETDLQTLQSLADVRVPAPSRVRPGLPRYLDQIVLRALARDPEARYATAREFGRELVRALVGRKQIVGLAELAEWTDQLFPGGRACKRQLIEIASRIDDASILRGAAQTELGEDDPTRVVDSERTLVRDPKRSSVRPPPAQAANAVAAQAVSAQHATTPSETPRTPARRRRFTIAASAAVIATAALSFGFWQRPVSFAAQPSAPALAAGKDIPVTPAPAPSTAVEPVQTTRAVGSAPYLLELDPPRGNEPRDIVIRINPGDEAADRGAKPARRGRTLPSAFRRTGKGSSGRSAAELGGFQASGMP
jgi:serine/threonine protein kinase